MGQTLFRRTAQGGREVVPRSDAFRVLLSLVTIAVSKRKILTY